MTRRKGRSVVAGIAFLMTAMLILACGVKGDPKPPKALQIKPVSDLEMTFTEEGIRLSWGLPADGSSRVARFRIFRSELQADGSDCPGCPRSYERIADLASEDAGLRKEGGKRFVYEDILVTPGRIYGYHVIVCDKTGLCSEPSNQVESKFLKNGVSAP